MDSQYTDEIHNQGKPEEGRPKNEIWEWIKAIIIAVLIAAIIRIFLFAPIVVDGPSMIPTLQDREKLIINKAIYLLDEPQRGDIVVFHATESKDWIKRVIAGPGDTVQIKEGVLYINGKVVKEPYLSDSNDMFTSDFSEKVPEGQLFVMGDNRPKSRDSRYIGPIPIDSVVGRAEFVFWPIEDFRWVK